MNSLKYFTNNLKLKTITPVYIGANQANELSPYSDYIQVKDQVIMIDQKKLEKALAEKPLLIDEFVRGIRASIDKSRTRSEFNLSEFLKSNFQNIEQFEKISIPCDTDLGKTKIKRFISTSGFPFIPGSTLKGAIRTAIIYDWIINSNLGNQVLSNLTEKIIELYSRKVELETKKTQEGELNKEEFDELKSLQKPKEILKKLDEIFNEQMIYGKQGNNPFGFDARHIKISDAEKFSPKDISISKLVRIKLKDESEVSPLPSEIINDNSLTSFSFTIEKSFKQQPLLTFNTFTIEDYFKLINQFSLATIEYEINAFTSFHNLPKSKNTNEKTDYSNVIKFYSELKDIIIKSENKFCVLRLGSGKTYFDNSIGIAIYNKDKHIFKKFRELLELGKNPKTNKLVEGRFPTTRTIVESTSLPIGWTAIEEEKNNFIDKINLYSNYSVKKDFKSSASAKIENIEQNPIKSQPNTKENYIIAEIIDANSKPPKVKILEGEHFNTETILPNIRLEGLGLSKGSKIYVKLIFDKKILQKAEFKGKVD